MEPQAFPVDSLTVPETTLLQHLQRGAPDAEIAVRLGLPIGEEKAWLTQSRLLRRAAGSNH